MYGFIVGFFPIYKRSLKRNNNLPVAPDDQITIVLFVGFTLNTSIIFFFLYLPLRQYVLGLECIIVSVQWLCLTSIVNVWSCPLRSSVLWMSIFRLRIVLFTGLFSSTLSCACVWLRLICFWHNLIARIWVRCMVGRLLLSPHLSLCSAIIFWTFLWFFLTLNDLLHLSLWLSIGLSRKLTVVLRIWVVRIIVGLSLILAIWLLLTAEFTLTFLDLVPLPLSVCLFFR